MLRSEIPLVDFYTMCLQKAQDWDYHILICLIARYAESPEIYEEISKMWSSFHDLTGPRIIFIFAGDKIKNEGYRNYQNCNAIDNHYKRTLPLGEIYSSSAVIVSQYQSVHIENSRQFSRGLGYITPGLPQRHKLFDNHTLQISQLRDLLNIPERNIPCLHITYLQGNKVSFQDYLCLEKSRSIYHTRSSMIF